MQRRKVDNISNNNNNNSNNDAESLVLAGKSFSFNFDCAFPNTPGGWRKELFCFITTTLGYTVNGIKDFISHRLSWQIKRMRIFRVTSTFDDVSFSVSRSLIGIIQCFSSSFTAAKKQRLYRVLLLISFSNV
jgi:hypothetical protein